MQIIEAEKVEYSDDGLAALVFSAEGDVNAFSLCIALCRSKRTKRP